MAFICAFCYERNIRVAFSVTFSLKKNDTFPQALHIR